VGEAVIRSVAVSVAHASWVPERVESMRQLRVQLESEVPPDLDVTLHVNSERAPLHYWSETSWRWALSQGVDVCLFVQDDVILAPRFWERFRLACEAPWEIFAGHSAHPAGRSLYRAGHGWYTTSDGLIGTLYALRSARLAGFLEWRRDALLPGALQAITEDTMIGCYALAIGERIWSPLPALHDHLVGMPSEFANDMNPHRRPLVTWRDEDMCATDIPCGPADVVVQHLGRFWPITAWLLKRWCTDWTEERHLQAEADRCPPHLSRGWVY
jgi:hypothetical protein